MIRPATPDELTYIRSSWLRSYSSSEWALLCTPNAPRERCGHRALKTHRARGVSVYECSEQYWQGHRKVIDRLIGSSNVSVLVIDEPMVDGYIVRDWHRDVCHWLYVRQSARGTGIARALIADLADKPTVYSHRSRNLDVTRLPEGWVFDPYELMT